jgi:nucleotidyltransferase/DNA polymerase involved in DNA repair
MIPRSTRVVQKGARVTDWVLHVDMDQFIAAVEVLRRPELQGRPVVVGGDGDPTKRGVVSTASYEAREYGVHSGVPLRTALKRCPDAVFLPVDRAAYEAASAVVMQALREPGVAVEVMGWDEAFVAATTDDPEAAARDIQRRVLARTKLHCTVGIGQTKVQAKMATGFGKPAGVYRITDETWFDHFGQKSPEVLWGIGSRISARLAEAGITTVAQLAGADLDGMTRHFGPTIGRWLISLGQGRADSPVDATPRVARSRSRETTFQVDLRDWAEVSREVADMARALMADIAAEGRQAIRVWVKIRFVPFTTRMHSRKLAGPTDDPDVFATAALGVLELFSGRRAVRLVGVRAEYAAYE